MKIAHPTQQTNNKRTEQKWKKNLQKLFGVPLIGTTFSILFWL